MTETGTGTTQDDVRAIALALPGATQRGDQFMFDVVGKHFVWVYPEKVHPKKARVPNPEAIVVAVADLGEKEAMLATNPAVFFTTPHYDGYKAVVAWLPHLDRDELTEIIADAWRCHAPAALQAEYDARP